MTKLVEITFNTDKGIVKEQFFRIFSKKHITAPPVSYVIDEENDLGILKMDDCQTSYAPMIDGFFADVARDNIKNIVVDLRRNMGGNSCVIDYFIKY